MFKKLSDEEELIAKNVVNSCFRIHNEMGPGLLEKIYEICLAYELEKSGFDVKRQEKIEIHYQEISFKEALRLDLLVNEKVIIEIKSVEIVNPVWTAQILSHLKLTNKRLGFLINFNVPLIKDGVRRFVR